MPIEPTALNGAEIRERSLSVVFETLRVAPRSSRAELAALSGLSKPTVGAALRTLEEVGLVREQGRSVGRRGPSASLFEPAPDAALVLGVDIGAHYVRVATGDLDGEIVDELLLQLEAPNADQVLAAMDGVRNWLADRPVELAVVGSPGVLDPASGRIRSSPHIAGWDGALAEAVLGKRLGIPTIVENDVNLAALGELARGAGRGRDSFACLNVGSGLGAGLVLGGRLHRGRHGAAGEVGYLAVGSDPASNVTPSRGAMETRLSHDAVVKFARELRPDAPDDPRELFDLARAGDPLGRETVERTARELAVCIASITAVVDLELVLLSGGIGAQGDLLVDPTRRATAALVPYAPEIECAALGDHAVLAGALATGAERALALAIKRAVGRQSG